MLAMSLAGGRAANLADKLNLFGARRRIDAHSVALELLQLHLF